MFDIHNKIATFFFFVRIQFKKQKSITVASTHFKFCMKSALGYINPFSSCAANVFHHFACTKFHVCQAPLNCIYSSVLVINYNAKRSTGTHKPMHYRACVVDLLGFCVAYIVCTSNLYLISFLLPPLYSTLKCKDFFHFLVSSLFVLSNVIVEGIVGLYTCTKQSCIIQLLFFVVVCLITSCDTVVSCIKTLSMCHVQCVPVLPLLSYINLNIPLWYDRLFTNKLWGWCCLQIVGCSV